MRTIEVYINSYIDRLVSENASATENFTVVFTDTSKQLRFLAGETKCRVKLFSMEVPNSAYNFGTLESRLWFVYDTSGSANIVSIQIDTERVYSQPSELITELNAKFTPHASLSGVVASYDNNTKKITITNGTAVSIRLISGFRFGIQESILTFQDMNDRLGFSQNLTNTIIAPAATLTGADGVKMFRTSKYYLVLNESGGYYKQSIIPSSDRNYRIIGSVPSGAYGTLSSTSYISPFAYEINAMGGINELSFSLLDDTFSPLNLSSNVGITLSILFEFE